MSKLVVGHCTPIHYPALRDDIFGRMEAEIDRMFNEMLSPKSAQRARGDNYPKADIFRLENDLCFEIAMPHTLKEDVELSIENQILTVSGKMSIEIPKEAEVFQKELRRSQFTRSWTLDKEISEENLSVDFYAGILRIKIKDYFQAEQKPAKKIIPIK